MALTAKYALARPFVPGKLKIGVFEVNGDASYTTGGYAITAGFFGLKTLKAFIPVAAAPTFGLVIPVYDRVNDKLMFFWPDNNNAADSALVECPAATNLAGSKATVIVIGI